MEPTDETICQKLKFPPESAVYVIKRLRCIREAPFSLHTSYIPVALTPDLINLDLVNEQLCSILNQNYNLNRAHVYEELESVAATKDEAKLLEIPIKHPLLLLQDTITDPDGIPFEYAKIFFRGDKVKLKLEF